MLRPLMLQQILILEKTKEMNQGLCHCRFNAQSIKTAAIIATQCSMMIMIQDGLRSGQGFMLQDEANVIPVMAE